MKEEKKQTQADAKKLYDPLKDPAEIKIDNEAAKKWLDNGAQPTDTVRALLKKSGAIE